MLTRKRLNQREFNHNGGGNLSVTPFSGLITLALLAGSLFIGGCAETHPNSQSGKTNNTSVKVDENAELLDLVKVVKTPDDAAILEVLMGYRMLLLHTPDANKLDAETLKKSRQAYDRLESVLRHGGVRASAKDGGERVYTVTSEDKLSLQEVVRAASMAAEKNAREGNWDKARSRWKEMVQSKAAINFALDEAQWGISLSDALQSTLADSLKKKLKDVNESYVDDLNQAEIARQVKVLLEQISEVKIQRELKKLANRAWERDKKAGHLTAAQEAGAQSADAQGAGAQGAGNQETNTNTTENGAGGNGKDSASVGKGNGAGIAGGAAAGATVTGSGTSPIVNTTSSLADSLMAQGKYVAALKSLDKSGEQAWVKEKKTQIGDRFCEEKRRGAANSFKDFKKASTDSLRRMHLKRTTAELDSCLFYFPDLAVSQKVRKNREMVETELKKFKP